MKTLSASSRNVRRRERYASDEEYREREKAAARAGWARWVAAHPGVREAAAARKRARYREQMADPEARSALRDYQRRWRETRSERAA